MDKLLNDTKTLTALERQLQRRDFQIFKRDLAKLIETAQPEPEKIPQEPLLPTE
jgi:hypothetical protein